MTKPILKINVEPREFVDVVIIYEDETQNKVTLEFNNPEKLFRFTYLKNAKIETRSGMPISITKIPCYHIKNTNIGISSSCASRYPINHQDNPGSYCDSCISEIMEPHNYILKVDCSDKFSSNIVEFGVKDIRDIVDLSALENPDVIDPDGSTDLSTDAKNVFNISYNKKNILSNELINTVYNNLDGESIFDINTLKSETTPSYKVFSTSNPEKVSINGNKLISKLEDSEEAIVTVLMQKENTNVSNLVFSIKQQQSKVINLELVPDEGISSNKEGSNINISVPTEYAKQVSLNITADSNIVDSKLKACEGFSIDTSSHTCIIENTVTEINPEFCLKFEDGTIGKYKLNIKLTKVGVAQ